MNSDDISFAPFEIKDCALIAIATGQRAQNLRELSTILNSISTDSIYYHFWGGLLRPRFDDPEFHNDFAGWVAHALHDKVLAERLAVIDPVDFEDLDALRQELIEVLEERQDELDYPIWAPSGNQFEFIRSQTVVFSTNHTVNQPMEFVEIIPQMSVGTIFFHFIDAKRRNPNSIDDFQNWLLNFGEEYEKLRQGINEIDAYFSTLVNLRNELAKLFEKFFRKAKA